MKERPHSSAVRTKWLWALASVVVLAATIRVLLSPSGPAPSEPDDTATVGDEAEVRETERQVSIENSGESMGAASEIGDEYDDSSRGRRLAGEALVLDDAFTRSLAIVEDSSATYAERGAAVRGLGTNLNVYEIEALYRFLLESPPWPEQERVLDRAVKNDVLNLLRNQSAAPGDLTDVMLALFGDRNQDDAVRDYALQHMGVWHEHGPVEERERIMDVFASALDERDTSLAGTALIGLRHLVAGTAGETSGPNVAEAALAIVLDDNADDLSRVTALNLATGSDAARMRERAAEWAMDSRTGYPLRLASIAALGSDGSPEAMRVLERVEAQGDPHLRPALETAFRKLEETGAMSVNPTQP
jgi:hypothetical protein